MFPDTQTKLNGKLPLKLFNITAHCSHKRKFYSIQNWMLPRIIKKEGKIGEKNGETEGIIGKNVTYWPIMVHLYNLKGRGREIQEKNDFFVYPDFGFAPPPQVWFLNTPLSHPTCIKCSNVNFLPIFRNMGSTRFQVVPRILPGVGKLLEATGYMTI